MVSRYYNYVYVYAIYMTMRYITYLYTTLLNTNSQLQEKQVSMATKLGEAEQQVTLMKKGNYFF